MTVTEPYTAATQARQLTEKSIKAWRNGAMTFPDLDGSRFRPLT